MRHAGRRLDVGGLRTLVDHGRTGLRVPGRDPGDFAEAVERIIGDPTFAGRLSERAAEAAMAYTWTSMAARLRRVYADLTNAPSSIAWPDRLRSGSVGA